LDELFAEKSINNDDIVIGFIQHALQETDEFKAIL